MLSEAPAAPSASPSGGRLKVDVASFLLPSKLPLSELILEHSGAALLKQFVLLSNYLLQFDWIRDAYGPIIAGSLDLVQSRPVDETLELMASPVFRGWMSRFGKVDRFDVFSPFADRLLAQWCNSTCSTRLPAFDGRFQVLNNTVWLSDFDLTLEVAGPAAIVISKQGDDFEILDVDRTRRLARFQYDRRTRRISGFDGGDEVTRIISPRAWLPHSGVAVRNDIPPLCLGFTGLLDRETAIADELDFSEQAYSARFDVGEFVQAAEWLRTCWAAEYGDLSTFVRILAPRQVPPGWRARGMTVSSYQGAIWLMARGEQIFENIVHELSHVKLRYIEEFIPILANDQTDERFQVGWRTDRRPMVGIFEGVYVHLHMLMALIRLRDLGSAGVDDYVEKRVADLRSEIGDGVEILERHCRFTADGRSFLDWAATTLNEAR